MLNTPGWRGSPQYAFGLGLVAGGVLSALVLLTVGSLLRLLLPPLAWGALIAVFFLVMAARELGLISFSMPQNARLVPESVFRHGRFWGPFEFGLEMGTGVRTYVTSGLPYVAVLLVALFSSPLTALVAGIAFGVGRTLMTLGNLRYSDDGQWDLVFDELATIIHTILLVGFACSMALIVWSVTR